MKKGLLILAVLAAPLLFQLACGKADTPATPAPVTVYIVVTASFTPTNTPTSTHTGTPTVTPTATPEPPMLDPISPQGVSESLPPLHVTLGAVDPYGNSVLFTLFSGPSHGSASISGNTLIYTADSGYTGSDSLVIKGTDSVTGAFATETLQLTDGP